MKKKIIANVLIFFLILSGCSRDDTSVNVEELSSFSGYIYQIYEENKNKRIIVFDVDSPDDLVNKSTSELLEMGEIGIDFSLENIAKVPNLTIGTKVKVIHGNINLPSLPRTQAIELSILNE